MMNASLTMTMAVKVTVKTFSTIPCNPSPETLKLRGAMARITPRTLRMKMILSVMTSPVKAAVSKRTAISDLK